ncbi:unnamed protein product [Caenorhabditis brenneri]
MTFPLLRLPGLAREHTVEQMEVREQFRFATLSKKTKRFARNAIRQVSYTIDWSLEVGKNDVSIAKTGSYSSLDMNIMPIEKKGAYPETDGKFYLYVNDIDECSIYLLRILDGLNFFQNSKFQLTFTHLPSDFIKEFLTTSQDLSINIHQLEVVGGNPDDEFYTWLMENCCNVKRLLNFCSTTPEFQFDSQVPFPGEWCYLDDPSWLKLSHVANLFMNCRYLSVPRRNHQLTEKDLNQIVKLWMEDSKLEFFSVDLKESINFDIIMKDIEKEPIERAYVGKSDKVFQPGMAFKIRQKSGQEAVVSLSDVYGKSFVINTHFDGLDCDLWKEESPYSSDMEDEEEDDEE